MPQIKDWLKLLSFDFERGRFGWLCAVRAQQAWLARWQFMEKAGDHWWPVLGAIYMLTAVKRVRGIWKRKKRLRLAPAATTRTFLAGDVQSAVIEALQTLKHRRRVIVHTDSKYIQLAVSEWLPGSIRSGWKIAARNR